MLIEELLGTSETAMQTMAALDFLTLASCQDVFCGL